MNALGHLMGKSCPRSGESDAKASPSTRTTGLGKELWDPVVGLQPVPPPGVGSRRPACRSAGGDPRRAAGGRHRPGWLRLPAALSATAEGDWGVGNHRGQALDLGPSGPCGWSGESVGDLGSRHLAGTGGGDEPYPNGLAWRRVATRVGNGIHPATFFNGVTNRLGKRYTVVKVERSVDPEATGAATAGRPERLG